MNVQAVMPRASIHEVRLRPVASSKLLGTAWTQRKWMLGWFLVAFIALCLGIFHSALGPRAAWSTFVAHGCEVKLSSWCTTYGYGGSPDVGPSTAITYTACVIGALLVAIVGASFLSSSLVARELESGTFRFAFTQSAGRRRPLLTNLALVSLFAGTVTLGCGFLLGWYGRAIDGLLISSPWPTDAFESTPVTLPMWCLLSVTLGLFLGSIIRKSIPTVAATMVSAGALALGAGFWPSLSVHLFTVTSKWSSPLAGYVSSGSLNSSAEAGQGPPGAWLLRAWYEGPNGQVLHLNPSLGGILPPLQVANPTRWLALHHITYWINYQTPAHYWLFQGVEAAALLAVSACLVLLTLRILRRS